MKPGITGILLAGGLGRRMGNQDKGLQLMGGKPMAQWVLERLAPQVDTLLINANQNLECYAKLGAPFQAPVVTDLIPDFAGPLAGLHAALSRVATPLVLTAPCDAPFLPLDLAARLEKALTAADADLAVAKTFAQPHPVFCLCRRELQPHLETYLARGNRKVELWYSTLKAIQVPFDDEADAFRNINTAAELAQAQAPQPPG
ncbi:molybdenum cofactor guanylyltransferase MobA [Azovibrio restrictus]|uniref:molybdenum cofactor guanylyltransferase MobA n=1 Tax=Azovibrio restrictus TaxID=146938 RepID=UPI0026EC03FD|nr:molybdenum cofactor guanylyltransferase MobA [Azovibrio restrictus]